MKPPKLVEACMAHVAEMCEKLTCVVCDGQEFIYNRPVDAREIESVTNKGTTRYTGEVCVFFPVSCQHCGNTLFFSLDALSKDGRDGLA